MTFADIVVLALLALCIGTEIFLSRRRKKANIASGRCSGCCSGCHGCHTAD